MGEGRALLIESHPLLRQTLAQLLTNAGLSVEEAPEALDGVCMAVHMRPDFVILDASIRDVSSLALGKLIYCLVPQSKVILLVDDAREYCRLAEDKVIAYLNKCSVVRDLPSLIDREPGRV